MSAHTASSVLDLTLSEAADAVAAQEVSPVALVDAALERIAALDETLRAYVAVYEREAREVARAAETMAAAGHLLGPLHGVPIALKDNIALRGLRTTAASKVLGDWIPDEDATVAARLKGAGAIVLGKTNMHELAWGGTTDNPHWGTCRNPWDSSRFPAGSSGGSGAAVAARMCFGALGTDTGGSVRLPAAVNGIVGLRPTIGRVSNRNVVPLAWSMDTVGPMGRTVADCARIFGVIAGHDPHDPGTAQVALSDYAGALGRGVDGLRIGIVPGYSFHHLQAPVREAVQGALRVLEGLGARVVEVEVPHVEGNISAQLTVESCEPSTYHQRLLRERPQDYGEDVRQLLEIGELIPATHYLQAQRYRSLLRGELLEGLERVDCFAMPTLPFTATRVGETSVVIEDDVEEVMLSAIMQFTGLASLTGLPSLSLPVGFDADGLPIGMQLVGAPFDEARLLRIGAAYQGATDHHTKAPPAAG
jgi:aspartyl-tRNA(Asn)/glutamyl-tRNA(Gln) amidotransferase subunit A